MQKNRGHKKNMSAALQVTESTIYVHAHGYIVKIISEIR
jgi:hypothetical protein